MKTHKKLAILLLVASALIVAGIVSAGDLEPSAPPGSTMRTLDEIYNKIGTVETKVNELDADAPVEKTGQTTSYATGDDGDHEMGVAWPSPRFTDNGDGTVKDNLTNLVWLKNANCFGTRPWATALTDCNSLADGACGLTDGSSAGDWRLPSVKELQSLIDFANYSPALPSGHPFTGVQSYYYWSGTTYASSTGSAWLVGMGTGNVAANGTPASSYVWPVRSDN